MSVTYAELAESVRAIGSLWRSDRAQRQTRRHLDRADFDLLRDAGLLTAIAPVDAGGLWTSAESSARPLCELYRNLASADPSVALVSSMHAAVVAFWLASPDPSQADWEEQRRAVFASAVQGVQWGTITSEPGSGGDIGRTRAVARPHDATAFIPGRTYTVSGDKHFGSGSGITDRMVTAAIAEGESAPTIFVLDVRDRPWDGTAGMQLIAEWDGMGMAATQSHAMRLEGAPSVRMEWNGPLESITRAAGPVIATLFTAVVLGVVDEAVTVARREVRARADGLRAYERVEWSRAEQDHWVAVQAYEGALRAIESGQPDVAFHAALRAKEAVADLAEWDGMGMAATQSHAMRLEGAPSVRMEWNGPLESITRAAGPVIATLFTAVVLGVVDEAVAVARREVRARADGLRAYEQVEWSRAEQDHWVAVQAYEGALRAIESGPPDVAFHAALRAKEAVADLAEETLRRITRVLGGGTFSQRSAFAHWFEDVRALGFLRPPWGLAYDSLFATSIL